MVEVELPIKRISVHARRENAFCHQDYTITGGAVSLAIYDDRLEIWSDGTLPFDLKAEDLKREHA